MKGITNFDLSKPRQTITKYKIESSREFEVRYSKSLHNSKYKIIDPIKVLVENPKPKKDQRIDKDQYYIVEIEEEEDNMQFIYSYGKTLKKAIRDLRWQIIELYEMLNEENIDDTMPICIATKKFFKKHIEKY